jgi:hypothetical protein
MAYALFWGVFGWAVIAGRRVMLPLLFCAMSFGGFSILPPTLTGGITILPRMLCALALLAIVLTGAEGKAKMWGAIADPRRLGLLSAFMVIAMLVSIFMPRLFVGHVTIVGLNSTNLELLRPSTTIYTQTIYLTMSYCVALAICLIAGDTKGRLAIANAVVIGALCAFVTGILDVATHGTGLLDPFRTATYRLLADGEILGSSRIIGLMPEASAYGGLCAGLGAASYFLGRAIEPSGLWGKIARVAPFLALGMAALSTSSVAFLGLGMFGVVAALDWLIRFIRNKAHDERAALFREFAVVVLAFVAIGVMALLRSGLFRPVLNMLDLMVLHKSQSASFVERSMWNSVSLHALKDTSGLGVGVGSTRSSSWPVALVSGTGIAGAILMVAFLARFLLASVPGAAADKVSRLMLYGAKLSWLVVFVPGAVSSPGVDFGTLSAALFGIMAGMPFADRVKSGSDLRRKPYRRRDARAPLAR